MAAGFLVAAGCSSSDDSSNATASTSTSVESTTSSTAPKATTTTFSVFGAAENLAESPISVPPSTDLRFLQAIFTPDDGVGQRVVFQFEGDVPPGFGVEYVSAPVKDSTVGEDVVMAGEAILVARFEMADLEDVTNGVSRPVFSGARDRTVAGSEIVKQVRIIDQRSRTIKVAIGTSKVEKFSVRTFRSPGTIVIDFPDASASGGGATESNL